MQVVAVDDFVACACAVDLGLQAAPTTATHAYVPK